MIKLNGKTYLINGKPCFDGREKASEIAASLGNENIKKAFESSDRELRNGSIAYKILKAHNSSAKEDAFSIKFDALASHDITYVGIIQTARISGLKAFPIPYAMTNCHNSLCAVGGTINEDDHVFGLSAAKKYGGIYVPVNQAVIHQYVRETMTGCGRMILGSDSHTRYGALGTMGVGEGGPELVKQLLSDTYDIDAPEVVLVYLEGAPKPGVGPHDVALALCKAVFETGFVKNKILEFAGPGIKNLSVDFRNGIDVMTTETTCLSSIWETDEKVQKYFEIHGRPDAYKKISPDDVVCYDSSVVIDLAKVESMIALPFHPSNAVTVNELKADPFTLLRTVEKEAEENFGTSLDFRLTDMIKNGKVMIEQGIIAGCSGGTFENIMEAAAILDGASTGNGYFSLSVYPQSMPVYIELSRNGALTKLMECGAILKSAFCGPCFGAGDVPSNNTMSIRHTTRNFKNREGSKPNMGQLSAVALMDARSIAATAANKGELTAATDICYDYEPTEYNYDSSIYEKRIYNGYGKPDESAELRFGPNITDWPKMNKLSSNALIKVACVINDDVTTTDELIPSGETSSYRSNPLKLAEFALSRRVPEYVSRAKAVKKLEEARLAGEYPEELINALSAVTDDAKALLDDTSVGSAVCAVKPGDGSAREQAASCQRVLGGLANLSYEYATKRYRSNLINWGMLPFTIDKNDGFCYEDGDYIFVPNVRSLLESGAEEFDAVVITKNGNRNIKLYIKGLTDAERDIIVSGCLMNEYGKKLGNN